MTKKNFKNTKCSILKPFLVIHVSIHFTMLDFLESCNLISWEHHGQKHQHWNITRRNVKMPYILALFVPNISKNRFSSKNRLRRKILNWPAKGAREKQSKIISKNPLFCFLNIFLICYFEVIWTCPYVPDL